MTIYTAICTDELIDEMPDVTVIGSWRTREDALRKCAGHVVYRAELRKDLSDLLRHDENHGDFPNAPLESKEVTDYLMDELSLHGGYDIYNGAWGTVRFSVVANELAD